MARAARDSNPLARVHRLLAIAFDDTPNDSVVWMPSHTSALDVGSKRLGDGSFLSAMDRYGNEEADKWAKFGVEEHRVPQHIRLRVKEAHSMVWRTAKWIGAATWHANHSRGKPGRDTGASRRLAVEATKAARARHGHMQMERGKFVVKLPDQGGHTSVKAGAFWQCSKCMKRSRFKAQFESRACDGPIKDRWKRKSAQSILEHSSEHADQHRFQHVRMVSGDVIWCTICGAYGQHQARGLAQFCQGKFDGKWKGGGRVAQLKALKSNRHPKTGEPLPPAIPESEWLKGKRTYIGTASASGLPSVHGAALPIRLCKTSATILDRLRQRRAGHEVQTQPISKRRRITGKSSPVIDGGTEVERRVEAAPVEGMCQDAPT